MDIEEREGLLSPSSSIEKDSGDGALMESFDEHDVEYLASRLAVE